MSAWLLKITIFLAGWAPPTRWKRKSEEQVQKSQLFHSGNYTDVGGGNGRMAAAVPGAGQASGAFGEGRNSSRGTRSPATRPASPSLGAATTRGFFQVPCPHQLQVRNCVLKSSPQKTAILTAFVRLTLSVSVYILLPWGALLAILAEVKAPCSTIPQHPVAFLR